LNGRSHTDLTVAITMELQIVISATLPSFLRNLQQEGQTKTGFFPTRWRTLLEWGKSPTTYAVPLGISLSSRQTQSIPFMSRTTFSHFMFALDGDGMILWSKFPPTCRGICSYQK
jgi:hypothetical protein